MDKITFDSTMKQGKKILVDIQGVIIPNITIGTTNTTIEHGLGKNINGWIILTKDVSSDIYEVSRNKRTLVLIATVSVVVDILVI